MKRSLDILALLLLGIVMLGSTVMQYHHHGDGGESLCMCFNAEEHCGMHGHEAEEGSCAADDEHQDAADCAMHLDQGIVNKDNSHWADADFAWVAIIVDIFWVKASQEVEPLRPHEAILTLPQRDRGLQGLRAPPMV